ncbi:Deazaflavin-dependent nitroreductase [Streptomyces sp. RB5]|uniref:Deazaflavin-dependent nitroreductase n=1 Tax=Streptomyces smaragdinus TaxID=2585196 RepID=A0A7K0CLS7_9ACTN|nr:nitroreductase/quinone reductase family protein [Streptomyces smaragdinus]MQY14437.1 Deazaflavin-dependent nitroreductase [Streptomyces smaragdinus]
MTTEQRNALNQQVIDQFREQGGTGPIGEMMHADRMVLLTHTGARTGTRRTTPMGFWRLDGDRVCVVASNMGAVHAPDWYHNVVAHPEVTVELGAERYAATAVPVTGAERDRLWAELLTAAPFFADHEKQAGRTIPLVELRRRP